MEKRSLALTSAGILVFSILVMAGCQTTTSSSIQNDATTKTEIVASSSPTGTLVEVSNQAQQIDKTVTYDNPGGGDPVRFQLEIKDGVIVAARSEVLADNPISQKYQTSFRDALASTVVGKKLAELQVDRIGGASLTSGAFRKVVQDLQQQ